jgi:hypothetical protein
LAFRPDLVIKRMDNLISVKSIGRDKYISDEYILLDFYIPGIANDRIELVKIIAEIHLVPNLKAKMLIGVNIIKAEDMDISFNSRTLTIAGENEWVPDI